MPLMIFKELKKQNVYVKIAELCIIFWADNIFIICIYSNSGEAMICDFSAFFQSVGNVCNTKLLNDNNNNN